MKLFTPLFSLLLIGTFLMSSCSKSDDVTEAPCMFDIVVEPVCSFIPKNAQTVPFPVRILREGATTSHPDYEFTWSTNADFKGSAISVTYEQLPLTVNITEVSTGCVSEATLENTYWD